MKKRLISVLAAAVFALAGVGSPLANEAGLKFDISVFAADIVDSGTCGENVTWTLDSEGSLTISGTGEMESTPWLQYRDNIKNVIINDGITLISRYAFSSCKNLKNVAIPNSVKEICERAFTECDSLTNIDIPDSVINIGFGAFINCKNLSYIILPKNLNFINSELLYNCSSLTEIILPDSVNSIGQKAFFGTAIKNLIIPEGVTELIYYSLYGCKELETVHLPNSITKIGYRALANCTSLKRINLPKNLQFIDREAFSGCGNIGELILPDSMTGISEEAFRSCSADKIVISKNIKSITQNAFKFCSVKNVIIKDGVECIEHNAFEACDLEEVFIPNSITTIEYEAFYRCNSMKCVTIPSSVTSIGYCAFGYDINSYVQRIKIDGFKIIGTPGSAAEKYAIDNGFEFELIEDDYSDIVLSPEKDSVVSVTDADSINMHNGVYVSFANYHNVSLGKGKVHIKDLSNSVKEVSYDINSPNVKLSDKSLFIDKPFISLGKKYAIVFDEGSILVDDKPYAKLSYDNFWTFETEKAPEIDMSNTIMTIDDVWTYYNNSVKKDFGLLTFEDYYNVFKFPDSYNPSNEIKAYALADSLKRLKEDDGSHGLCAGFVIAAVSSYINKNYTPLKFFNSSDNTIKLKDIKDIKQSNGKINIEKYIKYAHIYQFNPEMMEKHNKSKNDLYGLYKAVKNSINKTGNPVKIVIRGSDENNKNVGHVILAVGIGEDNDNYVEVLVYDPAYPLYFRTLKLKKNNSKSINSWEYNTTDSIKWGTGEKYNCISYLPISNEYTDWLEGKKPVINDKIIEKLVTSEFDILHGIDSALSNKIIEILYGGTSINNYESSELYGYWVNSDDDIMIQNGENDNKITIADLNESIETTLPANAKLTVNVNDDGDDLAKVENISDGETAQIDFVSYKDSTDTEAITDKVQITVTGGENVTATNHDGYVEVTGAGEFDIITTDNDKIIDTKHIVADEHGVKVEINDNATIKDATVDTNDDGQYDEKDSSESVFGDINNSGTVDVDDLVLMQKIVAGWNTGTDKKIADLNGDKDVDVNDLVLMQKIVAGWNVLPER